MPVIKAYFDDSQDGKDCQYRVCSVAGYIATIENWRKFEKEWNEALKEGKVPYLHMKDFAPYKDPFDKFKDNEKERVKFLQSLIKAVKEADLNGIVSIILLDDLKKFNIDRQLNIDAFAFNLYVCMTYISLNLNKVPVEVIIDRTNKPGLRRDLARSLADTDQYFPECGSNINVDLLDKGLTYKQVVPIQAADFLSWEARKDIREKVKQFYKTKPNIDLYSWLENLSKKNNYYRKSLKALLEVPTEGFVLDYDRLCMIADARKNIWPSLPKVL